MRIVLVLLAWILFDFILLIMPKNMKISELINDALDISNGNKIQGIVVLIIFAPTLLIFMVIKRKKI